ncbi:hypothetical protein L873DRAFT_758287 [Choiromyces venosus 120613-1]|uniref:Uncharacterized protein n=1 Tax=Choiromyces venosus 120613-1 TaxID=1336337 RepID=A0A3N4JUD3_9PEZI|nr:hypothetical protein L873DRAFT_758287 [Choiromyces venosus 120613-1]
MDQARWISVFCIVPCLVAMGLSYSQNAAFHSRVCSTKVIILYTTTEAQEQHVTVDRAMPNLSTVFPVWSIVFTLAIRYLRHASNLRTYTQKVSRRVGAFLSRYKISLQDVLDLVNWYTKFC